MSESQEGGHLGVEVCAEEEEKRRRERREKKRDPREGIGISFSLGSLWNAAVAGRTTGVHVGAYTHHDVCVRVFNTRCMYAGFNVALRISRALVLSSAWLNL